MAYVAIQDWTVALLRLASLFVASPQCLLSLACGCVHTSRPVCRAIFVRFLFFIFTLQTQSPKTQALPRALAPSTSRASSTASGKAYPISACGLGVCGAAKRTQIRDHPDVRSHKNRSARRRNNHGNPALCDCARTPAAIVRVYACCVWTPVAPPVTFGLQEPPCSTVLLAPVNALVRAPSTTHAPPHPPTHPPLPSRPHV